MGLNGGGEVEGVMGLNGGKEVEGVMGLNGQVEGVKGDRLER